MRNKRNAAVPTGDGVALDHVGAVPRLAQADVLDGFGVVAGEDEGDVSDVELVAVVFFVAAAGAEVQCCVDSGAVAVGCQVEVGLLSPFEGDG